MRTSKKIFINTSTLTITLLLLVICIFVTLDRKEYTKQGGIDIAVPNEGFYKNNYGCSLNEILSFWNFTTYELSNKERKDSSMFRQIQVSVRDLVKSNDSKTGIHVKFNLKTKYEDVIRAIDICQIEEAPTYILNDYDLWIVASSCKELRKKCPLRYPITNE